MPRPTIAARAMLAAIFILFALSVSATEYPYIPDDFIASTQGFWAAQGDDYTITPRTLTGAVMPILTGDLGGDGVDEIVVFDSTAIRFYHSKTLTQVGSYTVHAAPIGSYIFDWDSDGNDDLIFINGTASGSQSSLENVVIMSFNGTVANVTHKYSISTSGGQSGFYCDATNKQCLLPFSWTYHGADAANPGHLWLFGVTPSYGIHNFTYGYSATARPFWCFPLVNTAQYADYDKDGTTEIIFSSVKSNSYLAVYYALLNGTGYPSIEDSITTTASIEPGTNNQDECYMAGHNYSSYFTPPSVYDYDPGGDLETVLAYQKTSSGEFEMKLYDSDGSTLGTYPSLSTADGSLLSGIMRGYFFTNDESAFCVLGQEIEEQRINVLCGSATYGGSITNREYGITDYTTYSGKQSWPSYQSLAHASNEDADSFSEIVSGFGIIDLELPNGVVCTASGFCDATLDWENPKSNSVVIPVDFSGVGRHDLLMHTITNIYYFDDNYDYTNPTINYYYVDPCLGSTWKINTTVEVRIEGGSEDDATIQGKAILYYGTANAIDSGYTPFLSEGTTLTFTFTANQTIGSGTLRLFINDSHSLTDYEDLSFTVGNDGVEFGDCSTEEDLTTTTTPGPGTNVSTTPSAGNSIEEVIRQLEDASGLGSTLLWVIFMLGCSVAIVMAALKGGWGGTAMSMMLLVFNGGLLVMGSILGFIGTGVIIVLALLCLVALGIWAKDAFAGGGA